MSQTDYRYHIGYVYEQDGQPSGELVETAETKEYALRQLRKLVNGPRNDLGWTGYVFDTMAHQGATQEWRLDTGGDEPYAYWIR